ncbi:GNAT family N-acetyltransferase [Streptomyces sp. NPDC059534]|uniref:GNAT family N-acetyltransferase n=1 Tax=Streptomyces sp. NPDC059534 TaxID=3346859 RepID=UPI0036A0899E
MPTHQLLARARGLWEELAGVPVTFAPEGGVRVVVSPESGLCPAGWTGVVLLGGSVLVTVPSARTAELVRDALRGWTPETAATGAIRDVLPVAGVLGPAALAYLSGDRFRPAAAAPTGDHLPGGHPALRALELAAGDDDAAEAALDEITSPAFVVRERGEVVAAAGYRIWPHRTAHLSVLTAPAARGRGLARAAASAAVGHALAAGLLPQWRARPPASRRVAAALGFEDMGAQLSVELAPGEPGTT